MSMKGLHKYHARRLGIETNDVNQAIIHIDYTRLLKFITDGLQTESILRFFAKAPSEDISHSLPAWLAAAKSVSTAVFDAPARAVSASLGLEHTSLCGNGSFLSFQRWSSAGTEIFGWCPRAGGSSVRLFLMRRGSLGTCTTSLCCSDGIIILDAQLYKDEQLVILLSAPGDEYRLDIIDCSQLAFQTASRHPTIQGTHTHILMFTPARHVCLRLFAQGKQLSV